MFRWLRLLLACATICWTAAAGFTQSLIPNGSFEEGTGNAPPGWVLVGKGQWMRGMGHTGKRCLMVDGDGQSTVYWQLPARMLEPGQTYQFSYWYRTDKDAERGCIISGPNFANDDHGLTPEWTKVSFAFAVPQEVPPGAYLRLGVWMTKGRAYFDDVALFRVKPIHRRIGELVLGEGESVAGSEYRFSHPFAGFGNNYARTLQEFSADFNSNRWVFTPGRSVIYRHAVPGALLTAATVEAVVNYHVSGNCVVEASRDGKAWERLGSAGEAGSFSYNVPPDLLPANELYVRLSSPGTGEGMRPDSAPGSFQVNSYVFSAKLDKEFADHSGGTAFLAVLEQSPAVALDVQSMEIVGGVVRASALVTNKAEKGTFALEVVATQDGKPVASGSATAVIASGEAHELKATCTLPAPGDYSIQLRLRRDGRVVALVDAGQTSLPVLADTRFGYLITSDNRADVWWCEGAWKISRDRPAPNRINPRMYVEACRDEYESVQLVLRPRREISNLRVRVTDLRAAPGKVIPATEITVKQVEYVRVKVPTDSFGAEGWWPDPLPPVEGPLTARADENLPFWLTVHVPRGAAPGIYEGTIMLAADGGWRVEVPLRLRVFAFALPQEFHVQTALGLSQWEIWRYHNLTAPEDEPLREKVWDLYMQNWRAHHISPYRFWTRPFRVEIKGFDWNGGRLDATTAHGGRQSLVVEDTGPGNPAASTAARLPIDRTKSYVLRFWAKTKTDGQEFMVTVGQFAAGGRWIPYHNIDLVFRGTTEWKQYEAQIPPERFSKDAVEVELSLRGSRWVEDGSTAGTTWFDDVYFAVAPDGPNMVADPSIEKTADQVDVTIDWTEWDKQARKYLDGYGFNTFSLPVMGLGWGRYPNYDKGRFGPFEFGTPEYEQLMGKYLRQLQEHLEQNGWLKKAYIYWYDEPETDDYPFVVERMNLLKRLAPKLTRMLTEQPEEPLLGAVDLWCPVLNAYRPKDCQARQKLGERVWWYICCGPRAPYLGEFIDHPHTDMRAWLWATWKWNVEGCLIWTTNWWTVDSLFGQEFQNPWEDPMSYTADSRPGLLGYWGNGDGRFLYPPNRKAWQDKETKYVTGPIDSYRWELFRDGLEDWEYLYLLRELVNRRRGAVREAVLLQIPKEIMGENASQYTHEPGPILEHRHKVAEAIEKLLR
ncbi:MAG: DUF4091 domain-containing protein [Armatimonadetes bacterium]|nr:DUF4091 domain-containing protein [Armatimonadota bacterium]